MNAAETAIEEELAHAAAMRLAPDAPQRRAAIAALRDALAKIPETAALGDKAFGKLAVVAIQRETTLYLSFAGVDIAAVVSDAPSLSPAATLLHDLLTAARQPAGRSLDKIKDEPRAVLAFDIDTLRSIAAKTHDPDAFADRFRAQARYTRVTLLAITGQIAERFASPAPVRQGH